MYNVVMPQLSDSMAKGKLIEWKVKEGDSVKNGDIIAEVESDKAIMEVQSFRDGIVKELKVKAGQEVPVGEVIAVIDDTKTASKPLQQKLQEQKQESSINKEQKKAKEEPKKEQKEEPKEKPKKIEINHKLKDSSTTISPKARALASKFNLDLNDITQKLAKKDIYSKDIQEYLNLKYFTPKALKLINDYQIDTTNFNLNHKITEDEVLDYIKSHNIPKIEEINSMQKAIINNVTKSAQKPIYHMYDYIDATLILQHSTFSITTWLIKIFAKVIMKYPSFRSTINDNSIKIYPNASISLAMANNKLLYMPVIKAANNLTIQEIANRVQEFKEKLKNNSFDITDFQDSTFGISNLGMLKIDRFDAMINKNDSAIAAIGALKDNQISITITCDHRLINGYEAALFMNDLKDEFLNPLNFKE